MSEKHKAVTPKQPSRIRRGTVRFRPRARLIRTLGRDLITNQFIALQELVKNAYDADAEKVRIVFEEPLRAGEGALTIEDDGDGMTLKRVRTAWMEPATSVKRDQPSSRKGRRVTGEKGIGRFAAARVAAVLELSSIARETTRQVWVRFEWGRFEDSKAYLDQVKCRWEERPQATGRCGTTLKLLKLNDDWDDEAFRILRAELARLVSPLAPPKEFTIELVLPEPFRTHSGIVAPPPVLGKPHYRLSGKIAASGVVDAAYEGAGKKEQLRNERGNLPRILLSGGRAPRCGPFSFEFRVWDRSLESLEHLSRELGSTIRDLRRDLNSAAGISIYRDDFRVLLPENDWLRLDLRRVQNPTLRLSNNQIVGQVSISADANSRLRDQTNRQGIVDSPEFTDFKESVKALLAMLEVKRELARKSARPRDSGIFQKLDLTPIREYLQRRYPNDMELRHFLTAQQDEFSRGIGEVKTVLARYRRLATLGQLIDVVLHEGRTPASSILNETVLARRDLERLRGEALTLKIAERLDVVEKQTQVLTALFARISPFSGRRRGRAVETTIEKIIEDSFGLFSTRIRDLKVDVLLPHGSTPITVDAAEMQLIFVNLLDNALYWLERVAEDQRRIIVEVKNIFGDLHIVFADSGPGVPEDIQDRIFDPYFSSKPDGIGLGLTIAGETCAEHNGSLELLAEGPLPGATFRVVLRRGMITSDRDEAQ